MGRAEGRRAGHARGMPRRVPLPAEARNPLLYRDARALGVGEGRLRGRDLERPFYGVRSAVDHAREPKLSDLSRTLRACRQFAPLLTPDRFFSHDTAAVLWGCPLPDRMAEPLISVSALAPHNAPRGVGVSGHRSNDQGLRMRIRYGFPVSDPASTWLALAESLPLDELVAVGDHLVLDPAVLDPCDPRPYVTIHELAEAARRFHGRGARKTALALQLVRVGAESRPETLLRLLLLRAQLPEPELNVDVTSVAGRVLGRGDLVWRAWRTVVEYDGDQHRTNDIQYDRDITRIESFVREAWHVVRIRKRGLFVTQNDTIVRVQRALRAGGWRP
jgi:hypothetical protein